jgi:hypothetical protein
VHCGKTFFEQELGQGGRDGAQQGRDDEKRVAGAKNQKLTRRTEMEESGDFQLVQNLMRFLPDSEMLVLGFRVAKSQASFRVTTTKQRILVLIGTNSNLPKTTLQSHTFR